MDLGWIKRVGVSAAGKSGTVLDRYLGKLPRINEKGMKDLVTQADIESEQEIISTIKQAFPDHCILAEESGLTGGIADCCWIIDPLDGTTNFSHQFRYFAVSIAFALHGQIVVGIVLNPSTREMFTAVKDSGSYCNGRAIHVSDKKEVSKCLLVTGFPYHYQDILPTLLLRFSNCLKAAQGVRRTGSAALDLCHVACGRFDAFWEQNLKPWDTAAGMLIAEEAGAKITDFSGNPFSIEMDEILSTNDYIHQEMISLLNIEDGK